VPLQNIELPSSEPELSEDVLEFLREADLRVDEFLRNRPTRVNGFVPCCFETVGKALLTIEKMQLAAGDCFCEWGSGFGVVASLAGMFGFQAYGIEIDRDLCDAARELASDFDIPVEFINGSCIPAAAEQIVDRVFAENAGEFALETHADGAYDELELDVCDFDLVFMYPWPGDEPLSETVFEKFAADGALLLTYNDLNGMQLQRKRRKRRRRLR